MTVSSNDSSNPFKLYIGITGAATMANRAMTLQTGDDGIANGGNLLLQPSAGNVGIGVTGPSFALDVQGGTYAQARFKGTGTTAGQIIIDNAAGNLQSSIEFANAGSVKWQVGNQTDNSQFFIWDNINSRQVSFSSANGTWAIPGCMTYNGGTTGTCLSDERIKKNINPFTLGLREIVGLNPITYQYNGLAGNPDDGNVRTGLIAQQAMQAAPGLVHEAYVKLRPTDAKKTGLFEINYGDLTFGLINAVKELKANNDNLAAELTKANAANDNEAAQIKALTARLDALEAARH